VCNIIFRGLIFLEVSCEEDYNFFKRIAFFQALPVYSAQDELSPTVVQSFSEVQAILQDVNLSPQEQMIVAKLTNAKLTKELYMVVASLQKQGYSHDKIVELVKTYYQLKAEEYFKHQEFKKSALRWSAIIGSCVVAALTIYCVAKYFEKSSTKKKSKLESHRPAPLSSIQSHDDTEDIMSLEKGEIPLESRPNASVQSASSRGLSGTPLDESSPKKTGVRPSDLEIVHEEGSASSSNNESSAETLPIPEPIRGDEALLTGRGQTSAPEEDLASFGSMGSPNDQSGLQDQLRFSVDLSEDLERGLGDDESQADENFWELPPEERLQAINDRLRPTFSASVLSSAESTPAPSRSPSERPFETLAGGAGGRVVAQGTTQPLPQSSSVWSAAMLPFRPGDVPPTSLFSDMANLVPTEAPQEEVADLERPLFDVSDPNAPQSSSVGLSPLMPLDQLFQRQGVPAPAAPVVSEPVPGLVFSAVSPGLVPEACQGQVLRPIPVYQGLPRSH